MTHERHTNRHAVRTLAAMAGLLLAGCAGQGPLVVLDTAGGAIPLNASRAEMAADMAGPPPGMDPTMGMSQAPSMPPDGNYGGTAAPLMTDGGLCIQDQRVGNFRVRGTSVRYGGFRGRISGDGALQMAYGQQWIIGQFYGASFQGHISLPGRFDSPGCSYLLNLQRIGP